MAEPFRDAHPRVAALATALDALDRTGQLDARQVRESLAFLPELAEWLAAVAREGQPTPADEGDIDGAETRPVAEVRRQAEALLERYFGPLDRLLQTRVEGGSLSEAALQHKVRELEAALAARERVRRALQQRLERLAEEMQQAAEGVEEVGGAR